MAGVITARHRTRCARCGGAILPGERITGPAKPATGSWVHERCPQPAQPGALEVPTARYAYTDGACSGNPGPGGWAWAVSEDEHACGGERMTTNQRMEIQAALEAVRALPGRLVIVSDSTYVVNCFRDRWWQGWRARGWLNAARKPVANRDLWEPLVDLVEERGDVTFEWVKGHSGDRLNDLADRLAVAAAAAVAAR